MTFYSRWTLPAAMACGLLAACGSSGGGNTTPPPDGAAPDSTMDDAMVTPDGGGMDVTGDRAADRPADGQGDRPADRPVTPVDRPPAGGTCASPTMITQMPAMDGTISLMGSNEGGEPDQIGMLGLAAMGGCLGATGSGMGAKGNVVVYRYTMRTAGSLSVSTVSPDTDFDTVVAVFDTCTAAARPLGCNDDAMGGTQSLARTGALMAGQMVFIVVGGWGPTPDMAETGSFGLTIRETPTTPVGMPCTATDICAADSACVIPMGMTRGTCTADGVLGARCRLMGMACDMGLACSVMTPSMTTRGVCQRTLMVNDDCSAAGTVCPMNSSCRPAPNAMNPSRAVCVANGARGGGCRTDAPRCDMGLECGGTPATCRAQVMMGAECDFAGAMTFCATNSSCAPNAMRTATTCQANGAAAGTACRADSPRCDTSLECSTATGAGVCQRLVPPGMACDSLYRSTVCTMGSVCAAGTMEGAANCVTPTAVMEMEPNNTPMMPQGPLSGAVRITGALSSATDVDCFRMTVPAGASLFAETSNGMGGCPMGADTLLRVNNPMGVQLAQNDDAGPPLGLCSRLDGSASGPLNRLPAGDYTVCVSSFNMMAIPAYTLNVRVVP